MSEKNKTGDRIKIIAFLLPSLATGGMERVVSELANYLAVFPTVKPIVVLYGKAVRVHYELHKRVKVYKHESLFDDRSWLLDGVKRIIWLRKVVKHINPDVVFSVGTLWNKLVLLSLLGTKIPVIVSDRGNPLIKQGIAERLFARILYPTAAGIVAQTQQAKDIYLRKKLNRNIAVIPNPVRSIVNDVGPRENLIVSVGRLIKSKNFDRLIRIFHKLNVEGWKLVIIGGDALKQNNSISLQKLVERLDLEQSVYFTGNIKDVDQYLQKASIFAFTSSSEGFPNVIGEAMSAGLPVVTYDCPTGPSELINDNEHGFLIPLFDDRLFEQKLRYLIENDRERRIMGQKARIKAKEFSRESIGDRYYSFFINLKKTRTRRVDK